MPALKKSELRLIYILGGIVVLVLNIGAWKFILENRSRALSEYKTTKLKLDQARVVTKDKDIWIKRNEWFDEHQPFFESDATGKILEEIQDKLKDSSLEITRQQLLEPVQVQDAAEIAAQFTVEGDLESLIELASIVPDPDHFRFIKRFSLKLNEKNGKMALDMVIASRGRTSMPVKTRKHESR